MVFLLCLPYSRAILPPRPSEVSNRPLFPDSTTSTYSLPYLSLFLAAVLLNKSNLPFHHSYPPYNFALRTPRHSLAVSVTTSVKDSATRAAEAPHGMRPILNWIVLSNVSQSIPRSRKRTSSSAGCARAADRSAPLTRQVINR
ncbi:hypothetical protein EVAR_11056_1 [Eumeta japonica]|uniref:Uncharacterized protein n=1 Tax=Eumeta variegata TaxID=151549 RepID=A0A4C1U3R0_EUMVA|nr:hypothetical protein EVAR_11056_1 [Eumeta japonica]